MKKVGEPILHHGDEIAAVAAETEEQAEEAAHAIVYEIDKLPASGNTALYDAIAEAPDQGPSPLDHLLDQEEAERYRAALATLSPRDRTLIVLRLRHQLPGGEALAAVPKPVGAVHQKAWIAFEAARSG